MRKWLAAILCVCALSAVLEAHGRKEEDRREAAQDAMREYAGNAPGYALPGDCIPVWFTVSDSESSAQARLTAADGRLAARAAAFPLDEGRMLALLAVSTFTEAGEYVIHGDIERHGVTQFSFSAPCTIGTKSFSEETIDLDRRNTGIRTDTSPERLAQINRLNDILFARNPVAEPFTGPFLPPVASQRRTAQFGDRRTFRLADGKKSTTIHHGIDFGIPSGTPVFAAGDGAVVLSEYRISTGYTIIIEHLSGVYSLYYHLDRLLADTGEYVRTGSLIGESGSTGLSTGPHLHWEFRVNGVSVSPDWFLSWGADKPE